MRIVYQLFEGRLISQLHIFRQIYEYLFTILGFQWFMILMSIVLDMLPIFNVLHNITERHIAQMMLTSLL